MCQQESDLLWYCGRTDVSRCCWRGEECPVIHITLEPEQWWYEHTYKEDCSRMSILCGWTVSRWIGRYHTMHRTWYKIVLWIWLCCEKFPLPMVIVMRSLLTQVTTHNAMKQTKADRSTYSLRLILGWHVYRWVPIFSRMPSLPLSMQCW